jgi:uncharacterized SAM-binding protein YcdF (DUF218 family)
VGFPRGDRRLGEGLALGTLVGLLVRELDLLALVSFWGDKQYVVLGGALLGGGLAFTRLRPLMALAAAALGALWLSVAFTPLTAGLAQDLVRRDPVQTADAVYVLASNVQRDDEPGPGAASRLWRALELLAQDRTTRLVLSEIPPPAGRYEPVARAWLSTFRLDRELIVIGPHENTRQEALGVASLCRARGFERLLVVTSPTHSRRACAAFEREGLAVVCVPSVETQFDIESLEKPNDRVRAFGPVIHERLGLLVYRRRGWIR